MEHLEYVLTKFRENELFAKNAINEFDQKKIDFLGHMLSWKRVRLDFKKLQAIRDYKRLVMVKGIQSFLSLANFYQKFIKGFSQLVKLLSNLLNIYISFEWKDEQERASDDLKEKFSCAHVSKFMDFTKSFKVHTNQNDVAIDGVFIQNGHPIAFENKKFYGAQLRWPTHEKELYAIVCCLKTWQQYLGMHETKVFMDNVYLKYFETQPRASTKQLK